MNHFGMGEWADYGRGLAAGPGRKEMQDHLDSGCPECRQTADFVETLAAVCRRMARFEVPEFAVRNARVICPPPPARKRFLRLPVELIYDSFLAPAPAGLRSSWQVGWQALYRAGDCSLDVRIEPDLRSARTALIGQIVNHASPEIRMERVPVYLKCGAEIVAETLSNRFGEFQMEYEQRRSLKLWIDLDGGRRIVAPLRHVAADGAGEGIRITGRGPEARSNRRKENS